jgi:hypothetical protein
MEQFASKWVPSPTQSTFAKLSPSRRLNPSIVGENAICGIVGKDAITRKST